jgi:hypothetical protein
MHDIIYYAVGATSIVANIFTIIQLRRMVGHAANDALKQIGKKL